MSTIGELTLCPFCKEEIAVGAIKCKHCHSNLASPPDEVEGVNISDVQVVEYNEPGLAAVVVIVWGLYLFTFFLGITTIIGMLMALGWRLESPENSLYRNHFDNQIKLFFRALFYLIGWFVLTFIISFVFLRYFDDQSDWSIVIWMMVIGISAYVFIMSVIGLVKFFGGKPYSSPMPTTAD